MKRLWRAIALVAITAFFQTPAVPEQSKQQLPVVRLILDLYTYYPDPVWVLKRMRELDFNEFLLVFEKLVALIGYEENRWFYLYDQKERFCNDLYDAEVLLNHFAAYHCTFERLAVRIDGSLRLFDKKIYHMQDFEWQGEIYTPLLAMLKLDASADFTLFYATYCSYLSYSIIELVKEYTRTKKSDIKKKITNYFNVLLDIYTYCLRESEHDGALQQLIVRYYTLVYHDLETL